MARTGNGRRAAIGLAFAITVAATLGLGADARAAPEPATVHLEEMTWTEVRDAIASGRTTAIVAAGGTEQNGPHMALGKHNARARVLAGRIAERLGNALVAPVIAYVPEGDVDPPTGHMRFPGTISIPDAAFEAVLLGAARSLRRAGFRDIVLIGDSGNYQALLARVAARLGREWTGTPARAHHIAAYYASGQAPFAQALRERGLGERQIGSHAGAADTALLLAVAPNLVRLDRLASDAGAASGVTGDPRPATAALGQLGVELIVTRSTTAIRRAVGR